MSVFAVIGERERDAKELAVRLRKTGDIGKCHLEPCKCARSSHVLFVSCCRLAGSRGGICGDESGC